MMLSLLAALCAGAFVLLTIGRMGMPGLCSFGRSFSVGGVGFFCMRYLICFLSMILSHCCRAFCIALWSFVVGSLGKA